MIGAQIIKRIEAEITGNRYIEPLLYENYYEPVEFSYLTEYFVGVKLGHTVKIKEGSTIQEAFHVVKKAITELIFGEFRSDLAELQYQLYNRNFDEALKTAKDIERRMFYDQ